MHLTLRKGQCQVTKGQQIKMLYESRAGHVLGAMQDVERDGDILFLDMPRGKIKFTSD